MCETLYPTDPATARNLSDGNRPRTTGTFGALATAPDFPHCRHNYPGTGSGSRRRPEQGPTSDLCP